MKSLSEKIVRLHQTLETNRIPHAFGGALALAWCTQHARGTIDIDLNIFVTTDRALPVLEALPGEVTWGEKDVEVLVREGQTRIWWERTPLDIFLNTTNLHPRMSQRCRWEKFAGVMVPFLSCQDLAVLKVFFNRTKDWADLEEMYRAGTLDLAGTIGTIIEFLGSTDERIPKLEALRQTQ